MLVIYSQNMIQLSVKNIRNEERSYLLTLHIYHSKTHF